MGDSYLDGSRSDSEILPKVQIDYRWTDNFMTYAGVARGFRSGGFNTGVSFLRQSDFSFNPEYSWNYEIGFKSSFFDNRLIVNGAAFYIDLRDQQVTKVDPITTGTILDNAGRSRSMGFELETSALLGAGFQLDASYGYTNVEYRKYADEVTGENYKGNRPPLTPEHTYSVALQHTLPVMNSFQWFGKNDSLDWVNRIELEGVGGFYWNDANTLKQSGYGIFNLSSSVKTDNLTFTFWLHNLFDKQYDVVCFEHPLHPSSLVEVGAPRTFGVTLRADF